MSESGKKVDWSQVPWGTLAFVAYVLTLQGMVGAWIMQMVTGG